MLEKEADEKIVLRPISEKQRSCLDCDYGTALLGGGKKCLLTKKEEQNDSVLGFLTAENVFKRIEKHYKESV